MLRRVRYLTSCSSINSSLRSSMHLNPLASCETSHCGVRYTHKSLSVTSNREFDEYSLRANELIKNYLSDDRRTSVTIVSKNELIPHATKYRRDNSDPLRDIVVGDTLSEYAECRSLCNILRGSDLANLMLSSGERKAEMSEDCLSLLGLSGAELALCGRIQHRIHRFAERQLHCSLRQEGSIVSWLSCMDAANKIESSFEDGNSNIYSYSNVHCDKANNNKYDVSAVLYLNDDFVGGELAFLDDHSDFLIEPTAGRVVVFNSCVRNIHQVRPVVSGHRLCISVWFAVL